MMNATSPEGTPAAEAVMRHEQSLGLRPLYTLVRREFWEHRALWITPIVLAALLFLGAAIGRFDFQGMHFEGAHPQTPRWEALPLDAQRALFGGAVWAFSAPLSLVMLIVLWFYATDCLYAERRDRSILFWKSMPVSDAQTVLSKLLVAAVVVPLGIYLFNIFIGLVISFIWTARALTGSIPGVFWDTGTWLRVQGTLLVSAVVGTLWYAPFTAYLLLVSAWARRNVSLWVLLPPLVAAWLERLAFGTHHLWSWLLYRLHGVWSVDRLFNEDAGGVGPGGMPSLNRLLDAMNAAPFLANIDLWLGLLVAAVFVYGAIRIRRDRDDS